MRRLLIAAVVAVLAPAIAAAQSAYDPYTPVAGIAQAVEGDVLTVNGTPIRLYGVDAPEMGQFCKTRNGRIYDCGMAARNMLQRMVGDRDLSCTLFSKLRSATEVGVCTRDGQDVGALLVLSGWAFSARALSNRYEPHEARAQAQQRGLWSGRAERPWVWRQKQVLGVR
jgi:endonuclease YncB( thermonuclease family)